jgi:Protein of unknown function (DUF5818)
MNRETGILATTGLLLVLAAALFGQEPQIQPSPTLPAGILGPQLIVWSQAQRPQPVPQPLPPPDRPIEQPDQQAAGQPPNPPAQQQQPGAQTFTGTVAKDGDAYILKVSTNGTYQLDDQDRAKQYEGKQVKVAGTLDTNGHSLHIISIELIS